MVRKTCSGSILRDDSPCFYKIMIDPHDPLRIPSNFMKHIPRGAPKRAILKDPTDKSWNMELHKEGKELLYNGGWQVFLSEQHVEEGDFLLVRYDGNMTFHVRIFDKSGLEK